MSTIEITWLGNASVLLRTPQTTVLFDPYIELPGGEHPNRLLDFLGAENILITHAHLDHLASMPTLLRAASPKVYCTAQAKSLITRKLGPSDCLVTIRPGDEFTLGDLAVRVLPGQHIRFDRKLVRRTLSPANLHGGGRFRQGLVLYQQNRYYQENGETVFYDLTCGGLHLQLMGSLALRSGVDYPSGADVLFLPYQGSSDLPRAAGPVLERLRPKKIIATHFDDAFPPISQHIDVSSLAALVQHVYPETTLLVPEFKKPILIEEKEN